MQSQSSHEFKDQSQESIVPANPLIPTNPENTPEIPDFDMAELTKRSTIKILEAALAIQVGKAEPVGYSEASKFFKYVDRTNYSNIPDAHCAWLFAEAEKAGQLEQLRQEFPDVEMRAKRIIQQMQIHNPQDMADIMQRVSRPDYILYGYGKNIQILPSKMYLITSNLATTLATSHLTLALIWVICEQAIRLRPNLGEAYVTKGEILCTQGKFKEASACFQQAMASHPHEVVVGSIEQIKKQYKLS